MIYRIIDGQRQRVFTKERWQWIREETILGPKNEPIDEEFACFVKISLP
ncbi:MAG TPA: hypothetical protein VGR54_07550 [Nitrosopumilaceae archaeon]|nr:hypothetical protein [Nitrosopumilaceae archaeon]